MPDGWRWLPTSILDTEKAQKTADDWATQQRTQLAQSWAAMHSKAADAIVTLYGPQQPQAPTSSADAEMTQQSADPAGNVRFQEPAPQTTAAPGLPNFLEDTVAEGGMMRPGGEVPYERAAPGSGPSPVELAGKALDAGGDALVGAIQGANTDRAALRAESERYFAPGAERTAEGAERLMGMADPYTMAMTGEPVKIAGQTARALAGGARAVAGEAEVLGQPGMSLAPVGAPQTLSSDPALRKIQQQFEPVAIPTSTLTDRVGTMWTSLTRQMTDRGVDLSHYQEMAQKAYGRPLTAEEQVRDLSRLNPFMAAKVTIDEGLKPALQAAGADYQAVRDYMIAKGNVDVSAALSARTAGTPGAATIRTRQFSGGVSATESQQALEALKRDLGPERFAKAEEVAGQVFDFNQALLREKLDAGLITQAHFDQWTKEYPSYTPVVITDYLKNQMDGVAGQGSSLSVNSNGIKVLSLEGTSKVREDPWAATVRNAYETEALVKRNRTFGAFAKTIEDNPTLQALFPKVAGDTSTTNQERLVHGFVNGEKVTYMATTPEMAKVLKQEGTTTIPYLGPAMQLYKELITSKNPTFLVGNAAIDAPLAFLRMLSREGGNPVAAPGIVVDLAKGYLDAFKGVLSDEFKGDTARYLKQGGGMGGYFSRETKDVAKQVEDLRRPGILQINSADDAKRLIQQLLVPQGRVQTAATAGGAAYGAFSAGPDATPAERLAGAAKGAALGLGATKAIAATPRLGERIELGPRVAAFRQAERQGMTTAESVGRGRSVTVDFQEGGVLAKQLGQLIPFLNPAVQGAVAPYRMFRENPKGTLLAGVALVAPTLAVEAWNHQDTQRGQDYADVPDYVKDRGIVLMLPGEAPTDEKGERHPQYIAVNLRELAPVVQLTREVTNRVTGGQPRTASALLSGLLQQVSPIQSPAQAGIVGASTVAELMTNKDVYRNAPIVTAHADENASSLSHDIAGGMTAARRMVQGEGALVIPPSAVQYATSDVGGTVAQMAHGASDLLSGRTVHSGTPQDTPILGGFVRRFMRGDTGQGLTDAQTGPAMLSGETQALLHAGGIDIQATPVKGEIDKARLTRDEQARYQRLVNDRVNEVIPMLTERGAWDRADVPTRLKMVQAAVAKAHENAANEMRRDIGSRELKDRTADQKDRSAVLAGR